MAENSENTISMVQKQIDTLKENLKYLESIEEKLKQARRDAKFIGVENNLLPPPLNRKSSDSWRSWSSGTTTSIRNTIAWMR